MLMPILSLFALLSLVANTIFAQQTPVKDEPPDEIKRLNEFSGRLSYSPPFFVQVAFNARLLNLNSGLS